MLVSNISSGEIALPEIQRRYVWKPTQVARLVESLYRGYPTGYLLFWKTPEPPPVQKFAIDGTPAQPVTEPLYLLDGQQRLTALVRVFNDHPDAQVVFNVETQAFQNQSATTRQDPRWVKVHDVVRPETKLYTLMEQFYPAMPSLTRDQIYERLHRLSKIRERNYRMEVLSGFGYEEIAQIFVRVNSGGRSLTMTDLALATLTANWPGILGRLEAEEEHWTSQSYPHIDIAYLTRALAAAVLGGGLSQWSHARLARATLEERESGWKTVQRGLRDLVPLLKENLGISHSGLLHSVIALLPLIIFLGERPDKALDYETTNGLLYWLLVATIRNRYSSATDTKLGQDIKAVRAPEPVRALLDNLGIIGTRVEVTPRDLGGRGSNSSYFLLSFLTCRRNNARDWWFGTTLAPGGTAGRELQYHHIHPRATLGSYTQAQINDLANLAFISAKANRKISDRSPADYFPELGDNELAAHYIPLDPALRVAGRYPEFLSARRALLASAMTSFLDSFRPAWLDEASVETDPLAGCELHLTRYESAWESARLIVTAIRHGTTWSARISVPDLESSLDAAGEGLDADINIGGSNVPVTLDGDNVQIQFGPFLVTGTAEEWREMLDRTRVDALPVSQCPTVTTESTAWEPITFPVTSID